MPNNKWEEFAATFEEKNNYVVGIKDINLVKDELYLLKDLGLTLELACGNGTYTQCLVKNCTKLIASDISQDMLKVTKKRFENEKNVSVQKEDCFSLSFEDNSLDTIFMANLLHVIPNPDLVIKECNRVLKKDGRIIIMSFTLHSMSFFNKLFLKYRYLKTYGPKSSSSILTPFYLNELTIKYFTEIKNIILGKSVKAIYFIAKKI